MILESQICWQLVHILWSFNITFKEAAHYQMSCFFFWLCRFRWNYSYLKYIACTLLSNDRIYYSYRTLYHQLCESPLNSSLPSKNLIVWLLQSSVWWLFLWVQPELYFTLNIIVLSDDSQARPVNGPRTVWRSKMKGRQ